MTMRTILLKQASAFMFTGKDVQLPGAQMASQHIWPVAPLGEKEGSLRHLVN